MGKPNLFGRFFGFKKSYFGSDGAGHDVKAYGDTAGKHIEWDASANQLNVAGTISCTDGVAGNVSGYALKSEARTATATGATTGTISAGVTHVTVTATDANHIITLPAPVPGLRITLLNGDTGYELRSSDPANISINGGKAANAESAVAANTTVIVECVSATAWIGSTVSTAGVVGVLEVAAAA